jgi:SAM-dependent methyltransferase
MILPPGTILQRMYVTERVRRLPPGTFVDVGTGEGWLAKTLLDAGWRGSGYEPGAAAAARAEVQLAPEIREGRFRLERRDWLAMNGAGHEPVDLVASAMVLEHLAPEHEQQYLRQAARQLRQGGRAILIVPASPAHWGIEDEIAGHYRRYTQASMRQLLADAGWHVGHLVGLTFPLSNLLLPLSNRLVRRSEGHRRTLPLDQRTIASGSRDVVLKTRFPAGLGLMLNEYALAPWHWWQKVSRHHPRALVLYVECWPIGGATDRSVDQGRREARDHDRDA